MNGFLDILTDPIAWARRWGIRRYPVTCPKCGRSTVLSIPIAKGCARGLRSPRCECGHEGAPYVLVATHGGLCGIFGDEPGPRRRGRKKPATVVPFPTSNR